MKSGLNTNMANDYHTIIVKPKVNICPAIHHFLIVVIYSFNDMSCRYGASWVYTSAVQHLVGHTHAGDLLEYQVPLQIKISKKHSSRSAYCCDNRRNSASLYSDSGCISQCDPLPTSTWHSWVRPGYYSSYSMRVQQYSDSGNFCYSSN